MPVRAQRIQHVMQDTIINFYSTSDDYGDFSNFAAWPIKVDGKTWPTSEHYFQAQKLPLDEKHTENDAYWGDGGNGKGKNRLGYLLMELREQLAIEK
ncbi:hypothetical protein NYV32_15355 [Escherichia coli]|uniref:hypothetical protein n=1 Tax=Escherichia coli TaxID=562 RepID=UPI0022390AED|nr:hypothetical protein [Escherichia coli]MCW6983848.1 hypothetical protein [Escherichia coli]